MAELNSEYDVFLSHASEDTEWCEKLAERLRDHGVRVWFDKWELQAGDHLLARLNDAIEQSRKMVAVWSPHYFRDNKVWTLAEGFGQQHSDILARERPLIPILIEDCKIPRTLRNLISIDFRNPNNFDLRFKTLLEALNRPSQKYIGEDTFVFRKPKSKAVRNDRAKFSQKRYLLGFIIVLLLVLGRYYGNRLPWAPLDLSALIPTLLQGIQATSLPQKAEPVNGVLSPTTPTKDTVPATEPQSPPAISKANDPIQTPSFAKENKGQVPIFISTSGNSDDLNNKVTRTFTKMLKDVNFNIVDNRNNAIMLAELTILDVGEPQVVYSSAIVKRIATARLDLSMTWAMNNSFFFSEQVEGKDDGDSQKGTVTLQEGALRNALHTLKSHLENKIDKK